MKPKVFIDGSEGTTGLKIHERFAKRTDIELITIDHELRKDEHEIAKCINASDITFLCLPDAAAVAAVGLVDNEDVRILDTSTAHRTNDGWAYGFPELSDAHREKVRCSKRVAVPGCHATGFISLVYPLIHSGLLSSNALLSAVSISGYSGAGKKAIAQYSDEKRSTLLEAPRQYALAQEHKHMKEMKAISGLEHEPVFLPFICDYYSGMEVSIPLHRQQLKENTTIADIYNVYREYYGEKKLFSIVEPDSGLIAGNFLSACELSGRDIIQIMVYGNENRLVVTSRFDNLGKGASGAAVQCMNIMLGLAEEEGLEL